jgi:putative salt-induced outer membrane protein YdiY
MYEYEELADTSVIHRDHRLSSYLSMTLKIKDNLSLINTTYYQPKFADFRDFRISSQTDLTIKISKHFSFTTSYIYFFDAVPAENVPPETHRVENGLSFEF